MKTKASRNQVEPVTRDRPPTGLGPGTADDQAPGQQDVHDLEFQFDSKSKHRGGKKEPARRSLGGRVEKRTEGQASRWSLKQTLQLLKSTPDSTTADESTLNTTVTPIMGTRNAKRSTRKRRSLLNMSVRTPSLACVRRRESMRSTSDTQGVQKSLGGIQGALGLTPVMQMLNMQEDITTKVPDVIDSILVEKGTGQRKPKRTPRLARARRKILGVLNTDSECSMQGESSFLQPPAAAASSKKIKSTNKTSLTSAFTRQASKFFRGPAPEEPIEKPPSPTSTNDSISSRDVTVTGIADTAMIDLSLDSSLSLSRRNLTNVTDNSISSACSVETIISGHPGRTLRPRRSCYETNKSTNLRSAMPSTMSLGLTKALSDAESFRELVAKLAEKKVQSPPSPGCLSSSLEDLDSSYTKAVSNSCMVSDDSQDAEKSRTETDKRTTKRTYKVGNSNTDTSITSLVRKKHKATKVAQSGVLTPRSSRSGLQRSRSLRVWADRDSVEVTGQAGHTPLPNRKRRHPSYEERLIM